MKQKKTRAELHNDFVRECKNVLDSKNFDSTHHRPVDSEIERMRSKELMINDLFKVGRRVGRVKRRTGNLIDAVDVRTHEEFKVLSCNARKL